MNQIQFEKKKIQHTIETLQKMQQLIKDHPKGGLTKAILKSSEDLVKNTFSIEKNLDPT